MTTNKVSPQVSRKHFLRTLALGLPFVPAATALAENQPPTGRSDMNPDMGNLRAFVELARSDIRLNKALIVAQNLPLTEDEAVDFWPLHREYETDLNKILDERLAGIEEFIKNYGTMSDAEANKLAKKSFELEESRTDLKRKYYKQFCKVIPPVKAARFFQIENQLNMVVDLRVAGSLPLIK
jgi:hypothetical protein